MTERERHGILIDSMHKEMNEDLIMVKMDFKKMEIDNRQYQTFNKDKIQEIENQIKQN